jgi:hypothetical protein
VDRIVTRTLRLVRRVVTVHAYAFVGSEILPGSPFAGTGETWRAAYAAASTSIAAAVTAAHAAALEEPIPDGAVLAVVALIGTIPNELRAVAAALKACREAAEER